MMHQKAKFPLTFIPEANCQILELPYVGNELSMLIMLPNEMEDDTTGLKKVGLTFTFNKMGFVANTIHMEYKVNFN